MPLVRSEGVVLRTYALGDTSRIVVVYTRDFGLVRLVAKGARKQPSRFGFALEPLSRSQLVFYHKPDRELHLVSQADTIAATAAQVTQLARLAHAEAAIELVDSRRSRSRSTCRSRACSAIARAWTRAPIAAARSRPAGCSHRRAAGSCAIAAPAPSPARSSCPPTRWPGSRCC